MRLCSFLERYLIIRLNKYWALSLSTIRLYSKFIFSKFNIDYILKRCYSLFKNV